MKEVDLTSWNRFYIRYVEPIFTEGAALDTYYEFLKRMNPEFNPKSSVAKKFYDRIKDDSRFDEELKKFFSFLYSCGFFMDNIISFEEWLEMKNWENPYDPGTKSETILEVLKKKNGPLELKSKLRWLPYINRQDGF